MTTEQLIIDFNATLIDLFNNIAIVCPDSLIGNNIKLVTKEIKNWENKNKWINIFVSKVLPYKSQIDSGDESFFLNKSYKKDLEGSSLSDKIFEFKSLWKKLNRQNKDLVIQYMQLLCMLSEEYFTIIYSMQSNN